MSKIYQNAIKKSTLNPFTISDNLLAVLKDNVDL